jgi:hypothetical protein
MLLAVMFIVPPENVKETTMKEIVAYHPRIAIEGGLVLKLDLPDWFPDEEVLADLGKKLGVETVGEIVEALRTRPMSLRIGVVAGARVEAIREGAKTSKIWGLSERVG